MGNVSKPVPRGIMGVSRMNLSRCIVGDSDSLRSGLRHREVTIRLKDSAKYLKVRNSKNAQTTKYQPTPQEPVHFCSNLNEMENDRKKTKTYTAPRLKPYVAD